jgi:hypothetical protein
MWTTEEGALLVAVVVLVLLVIVFYCWYNRTPSPTPAPAPAASSYRSRSNYNDGGKGFLSVSDQLSVNPNAAITTTAANWVAIADRNAGRSFNRPNKLPSIDPLVLDELQSGTLLGMDYQSQFNPANASDYDVRLADIAHRDAELFNEFSDYSHMVVPAAPLASSAQQTAQHASSTLQAVKQMASAAQSSGAAPHVIAAAQKAVSAASQAASSAVGTTKSVSQSK